MKILVTGAGGFLGFHIAKLLQVEGHQVYNFSRKDHDELEKLKIPTRHGDLRNKTEIKKALDGIEAVFHVASMVGMWGKWEDFYQINVEGTKNLIESMKENKIPYFVYTSTPSVVFNSSNLLNENERLAYPKKFFNFYSQSKAMAEKFVLESNGQDFKTVALRPHLIYGERDQNLIPKLVQARNVGRLKIIGDGKNKVDIIYVENAAKAHLQAFKQLIDCDNKVSGKAYFLGQERPVELWTFLNQILEIYQSPPLTQKIPLSLAYAIGAICEFIYKCLAIYHKEPPMTRFIALNLAKSHYFSHQSAKEDFQFSPSITIEDSLKRMKDHLAWDN